MVRMLAVAGAVVAITLAACGSGGIRDVALAELVADESEYAGDTVRLKGTVVGFENPEHYVIEDANSNRVEIVPIERIAEYVGMDVEVTGRFSFSEDRGRVLDLDAVTVIEP